MKGGKYSLKDKDNDNIEEKEEKKKNKNVNKKGSGIIFPSFDIPMVSVFENYFSKEPIKKVRLDTFLHTRIFREQVERYRATTDEKLRKKIKGSLICITPSGIFSERRETSMIKHNGLLCVDIDAKDNPEIDWQQAKHIIGKHCPSLYYAGLSLSGKGLFLIFRISNPELHKQHFEALAEFISKKFELQVDRNVKSPVSLRVVSYDDKPYYNPEPIPFTYVMNTEKLSGNVINTVSQRTRILQRVINAVHFIQAKRIDITNQYKDWFRIGCALAHEFGEEGRHWFHLISRVYEEYNEGDCDIQYSKCLKYRKDNGITIGTFFFICKSFKIEV